MGGVNNTIRDSVLFTTADSVISWSRRSALWPETFGIACCAIEMICGGLCALRSRPVWRGVPAVAAPVRRDDYRRHRDAEIRPRRAPSL